MAVYVYKDLKQCAEKIAAGFGLSDEDGRRVIGWYNVNQREKIADIIAGDLSSVPAALDALGIGSGEGVNTKQKSAGGSRSPIQQKKKSKQPEKKEGKTSRKAGAVDIVTGAAVECEELETITADLLPASLPDDIESWLSDFSARYDMDLLKASGQQWRSACIYIGQHIQKSRILEDHERERKQGGKIYKPERVAALLPLWEYITGVYKHIPLVCDFISFSGVHRNWFYDYDGRELTSTRVQIVKKAREIEESGLSAGLVDGRENPTGRIYYSKARLGWRESVEIVHTSATAAASAGSLPDFGQNTPALTDSGGN